MSIINLALALLLLAPLSAQAKKKHHVNTFTAVGQYCHDGDTCKVEANGNTYSVRFFGIDCPELDQTSGHEAQAFTESYIKNKPLRLECDGKSFNRIVCKVFSDGEEINRRIVEAGWAWDSPKYSHRKYKSLELAAKIKHLGLWKNSNQVSPYCYRHETQRKCANNLSYMP